MRQSRSSEGLDDPTGKHSKPSQSKWTSSLALFIIGLCIGAICGQRYYIAVGTKPIEYLQKKLHRGSQSVISAPHELSMLEKYDGPPRNDLEELLRKIAPDRELLVAVANKNLLWPDGKGMLATFASRLGPSGANIPNHLIVVLDKETKQWCEEQKINAYFLDIEVHKAQQGTGDNHAVSAMKFGILKKFIELGYSVLLSDVDIVVVQNPFKHLYRDSDVEGMTDGFDEPTAYGAIDGIDDPQMGWARYAQFNKHFAFNSGLFYLRANERTLSLMSRLETRLSKQKYWDQTAFNEEIFFLSHGSYKSPQVSTRCMEIDKFMNSKRMFKLKIRPTLPVMVHINYHPDKHERMKAVIKYYIDKDRKALDPFPGGSEPGSK